jgi:hypothetical protein
MTYLLAFTVFLVVVAGMAIGVILSNKPIKGSCGGIGALGMDTGCEICGGDPQVCDTQTREPQTREPQAATPRAALFYKADQVD